MHPERRGLLKALALLATPSWAASNSYLRLPYLQCVQTDRASVLWTTAQPGSGSVAVSDGSGVAKTVKASMRSFLIAETNAAEPFYQYRADITGLQPGTTYSYSVSMDGQFAATLKAAQYRFRTAAPGKFSFLAFGDTGENSAPQRQVMGAMIDEPNIAMAIHTGDLAYPHGSFSQYESSYFSVNAAKMSNLPLFPTPGNHDYLGDGGAAYLASHAPPECDVPGDDNGRYYSYNWGDAHFVSLDSNLLPYDAGNRMLEWLQRDLAQTRKFWKIVYFHHPPYPTGHHRNDPFSAIARHRVVPILESAGVQIVIGGHEHGFERTHPLCAGQPVTTGPSTTYVITGGGGASLQALGFLPQTATALALHHYVRVDIDGTRLTTRAMDPDGNELDKFQLAPAPVIPSGGVVNGGDFSTYMAGGSLATVFGQNFAVREFVAGEPLPVELEDVTLRVDGILVPLFYASPSQVNFQIPDAAFGNVELELSTPNGSARTKISVAECAPALVSVAVPDSRTIAAHVTGLGAFVSEVSVWIGPDVVPQDLVFATPVGRGVYRLDVGPLALAPGRYELRIAARNILSGASQFSFS
jgi:uncharacterized protein (TIGR03437 family)